MAESDTIDDDLLELLTAEDVARLFKVRKSWVYDQVQAGHLPAFKLGGHLRFRRAAVREYLEQCAVRAV